VAHDAASAFRQLGERVVARRAERVGRIVVRADEIERRIRATAVLDEIVYPRVRRARRPADAQAFIDTLDRDGRAPVELEIILLRRGPERGEVRLVPYLEEPVAHFAHTVALDPVDDEPLDQRAPLRNVLRRRDV